MDNQAWDKDREPPCPQPTLLHLCRISGSPRDPLGPHMSAEGSLVALL